MGQLTIALLQMSACGNDQDANLKKGLRFCDRAARMGADLALLPEMWNIGYQGFNIEKRGAAARWRRQAVARDSRYVRRFRDAARKHRMAIAVTYLEEWPGAPRNSMTLIDRRGEAVMTYAKVHTCDFGVMEASCTPGEDFHVCNLNTRAGKLCVGAMICYDREAPESARTLMLKGAELVLTPNACGLDSLRIDQFKTRAFENAMAVAMTNYGAPQMNGHSVAFDAGGQLLVAAGKEEGVYLAELDLDALREYRGSTIWGNAFRRPHKYGLLTSMDVAEPFGRDNGLREPFDRAGR